MLEEAMLAGVPEAYFQMGQRYPIGWDLATSFLRAMALNPALSYLRQSRGVSFGFQPSRGLAIGCETKSKM